jgi:PAS domain S-box-containing protein
MRPLGQMNVARRTGCCTHTQQDMPESRTPPSDVAIAPNRLDSESFVHVVQAVRDYAIFLLTPTGHVASWNAGARLIKGYEEAEILGRHFSTFYTQDDLDRGWPEHELERARLDGRYEEEGWRVRKDGSRFWASVVITSVTDARGQPRGYAKITHDLTQRVERERQLRDSEERFRALLNGVVDHAVFMLDPEGYVESWNEGAERLKGYTAQEIVGQHFSVFYPPEAVERHWPERELRAARENGRFEDEGWRMRKDGSEFWGNVVITAIRHEDGTLRGYVKITRDMTERDRVRALERSARHTDEFLAMLGHELRNPLGSISNAAHVVQQVATTPVLNKASEILGRQLDHMAKLVDDLLDASRIRSGKIELHREPVAVQDVLQRAAEAVEPLIAAKHHMLALPQDQHLIVDGDLARLVQIFANLLSNAAKYTPESGRIEVTVKFDAPLALVSVRDNGIGIPDDMIARVFDLFVQGERTLDRTEGGLGVGLALARRLAEMHGGSIEARSDGPGRGSEFLVRLPAMRPRPGDRLKGSAGEVVTGKPRVLIVDDQADAADSLAMSLSHEGFAVDTSYSSEEALLRYVADGYSIALLDIGMPGLDGYELCRRIRRCDSSKQPLLIAITGYGQPHERERALAAGFDEHFIKPVDMPRLLQTLRARRALA